MGVRAAVVVVVLMAAGVAATPQDDITLTTNGYTGVTVAISDQLDKNKCDEYVNSIKEMVTAASRLMFNATAEKVYFGDVVIVVPESWLCQGVTATDMIYSWDSAHLRLGLTHYLFGDNPWTQQLGGCGEPGDWIYIPESFLMANGSISVGSPGNVLVHEWAKYRWGVFEEYGHAHDPIFPPAYRDENNTITPTYCTDQLLQGSMSCPEGGAEAECQFTPELNPNITVTSSLLAAPFLDSVISFCDAGNHNTAAPTKHNLLCDQSSAKDVMGRHTDMKGNPVTLKDTNFKVVRAAADWPRMVLLVEYTAMMALDQGRVIGGRWEQLRDNLHQFITLEAAAESYMGIVVFGSEATAWPIRSLSVEGNRQDLANAIPAELPTPKEGIRNLHVAVKKGAELLGAQGGTLVLLTQNLEAYPASQNVVDAAANNPVWPVLYPMDSLVSQEVFEDLAGISPDTSVLKVQNSVTIVSADDEYQSVEGSVDLHYSLLTATANSATLVARNSCDEPTCSIALQMSDNTQYMAKAYVKVFNSMYDSYVRTVVKDPSGRNITAAVKRETSSVFQVSTLQNGQYVVLVDLSKTITKVVAELWAIPAPLEMQVSAWSPKGLHNLPYSSGSAPRLLAKVTNSASWTVLFADVTAKVSQKTNSGRSFNITLNDAGIGGDVTGKDGVYSGYLVGFEPNVDVTITITATDNDGKASLVNPSLSAAPTTPETVTCCGSQLDEFKMQLEDAGNFAISSPAVSGRFTGQSPGTLRPGRVTDLQASRSGYDVTLNFTAPGAQLDQGQAEWYEVNVVGDVLPVANISGKPAGSVVVEKVTLEECSKVYTLTVVAYYNGVYGSTSNSVRETVPCGETVDVTQLSAGAIAGITIGCILGVLLLVLIIYLCLNSDHLDDLWVWRMLTCRCCPCCKQSEDDQYSSPSKTTRSDVIRNNTTSSKPVRNLADLYSKPVVPTKKEAHQGTAEDEDDGGFAERQKRYNNMPMRAAEDVESVASSHSTLAINQVGLPVSSDNHAYDDGPYVIYRNAPPVPRYPRANTQV